MKKILSLFLGVLLAVLFFAPGVLGITSRFTQEILPTDCILTVVATGDGPQVVGECPNEQPQITEVDTTPSGMRLIRGVYDADRTTALRVLFRGTIYTANTPNSPLTVAGDTWVFALDQLAPEVEAGDYVVTIEADIVDGRTLSATESVTIPPIYRGEADPGFVPSLPSQAPIVGLNGLDNSFWDPFAVKPPNTSGIIIRIDDGANVVAIPLPGTGALQQLLFVAVLVGAVVVGNSIGTAFVELIRRFMKRP